ncbi:hypothetical protein ACFQNF_18155 [Iodobacter arcticus]|jgi:hypothetical protein|uniref:Uncharacterized protein n=1 Tax=Iodobacter arcticus TaxID=590593 RepID=A0ABW2R1H5_9NEIS
MSENEMKLLGRETIEAYISEGGFICLKQESAMGEDPSIVMMLPTDIPAVVSWLQELAGEFPLSKDA